MSASNNTMCYYNSASLRCLHTTLRELLCLGRVCHFPAIWHALLASQHSVCWLLGFKDSRVSNHWKLQVLRQWALKHLQRHLDDQAVCSLKAVLLPSTCNRITVVWLFCCFRNCIVLTDFLEHRCLNFF